MGLEEKRMQKFEIKLDEIMKEIKDFRKEGNEVKRSMEFLNNGFESFKKEIEDIVQNQKRITKENNSLREEVKELSRKLELMKNNMEVLENDSLVDSLEIVSLPVTEGEIVKDQVLKISNVVGVKLELSEIKEAYRRKPKANGQPGDIVVKLCGEECRDRLMSAIKKRRLQRKDLGFVNNNSGIYVRELLTQAGKDLFYKALSFKKTENWRYIWTKRGTIFLREKDGERYHRIMCVQDLEKIKS